MSEIKKIAEEYIKALQKGDFKFLEKNFDFNEAYEFDKEFMGQMSQARKMSLNDYEKEGKSGLKWVFKKWDKKFQIRCVKVSNDRGIAVIDAEGAKGIARALILSKKTGSWKIILMPTWYFE
nr:nuclear transport factor 2 family protein [Candidatus Freyarchaeota archaeon]